MNVIELEGKIVFIADLADYLGRDKSSLIKRIRRLGYETTKVSNLKRSTMPMVAIKASDVEAIVASFQEPANVLSPEDILG